MFIAFQFQWHHSAGLQWLWQQSETTLLLRFLKDWNSQLKVCWVVDPFSVLGNIGAKLLGRKLSVAYRRAIKNSPRDDDGVRLRPRIHDWAILLTPWTRLQALMAGLLPLSYIVECVDHFIPTKEESIPPSMLLRPGTIGKHWDIEETQLLWHGLSLNWLVVAYQEPTSCRR